MVINTIGKARLVKFFDKNRTQSEESAIIRDCFKLVSKRGDHVCNFLEGGSVYGPETKIVYRHYATLYFIFVVDSSESELGILDLIHVYVEALDSYFHNVCELDLIYKMNTGLYILSELIVGGLVVDTHKANALKSVWEQQLLIEKEAKS